VHETLTREVVLRQVSTRGLPSIADAPGLLFDGAHDAEEIAAVDLFEVFGGVTLFEEGAGERGEFVVRAEVGGDAADAVEVGADADVVDAAGMDCMVDLGDDVGEGGGGQVCGGLLLELVDGGLFSQPELWC